MEIEQGLNRSRFPLLLRSVGLFFEHQEFCGTGGSLLRQGLSLIFHIAGNSRVHRSSVWRFAAYSSPFPMALRQDVRSSLLLGFRQTAIVGPRPRFSRGP